MATAIEWLNSRLSLALMVLALVGSALAFMDSRHASAMDVKALTDQIHQGRIDDLEYKIQECERRIKRILMIPEGDRTLWHLQELNDQTDKKAYYLRKMERLIGTKPEGG